MTNDEIRKNDEVRMTKKRPGDATGIRVSGFGLLSSFVIRASLFTFFHRCLSLAFAIATISLDYALRVFSARGEDAIRLRLAWVQRSSSRFLRALNIHVTSHGMPPRRGLLVSNHLGYLDILVLGAVCPAVFVSKSEVRSWPVFGWLAQCAGTLFVDRTRRLDVERVGREIRHALGSGVPVVLFPEGTSSDGSSVLPFRSSLLEPASSSGWPVVPACIAYEKQDGSAATGACYWGEMSFLPHLLNLLSNEGVFASVVFGNATEANISRKILASRLHADVAGLKRLLAGKNNPKAPNVTGEALEDLAR